MHNTSYNKSILLIGLGALGSRTAKLLCQKGVQLTFCDYDIVEEQNIVQQSLYTKEDIGLLKVDVAKKRLRALFPATMITTIAQPFSSDTDLSLYDIIIEGTDSLTTRLLINDAAKKYDKPLIIGAASKTAGMCFTVTTTPNTPCWQCIVLGKMSVDDCATGVETTTLNTVAQQQVFAAKQLCDNTLVLINNNDTQQILVKQNPLCNACKGNYRYLTAVFSLNYCQSRNRLQAKPNKPQLIDLALVKQQAHVQRANVLHDYGSALIIQLGHGTVLVHRHGSFEFEQVPEAQAKQFVKNILENASCQ